MVKGRLINSIVNFFHNFYSFKNIKIMIVVV